MHSRRLIAKICIVLMGGAACLSSFAQAPNNTSPGLDWEKVTSESVGYSSARFDALTAWLKTGFTTSMVVAVHGKIIYQYGDTTRVSKIAWCARAFSGCCTGITFTAERSILRKR